MCSEIKGLTGSDRISRGRRLPKLAKSNPRGGGGGGGGGSHEASYKTLDAKTPPLGTRRDLKASCAVVVDQIRCAHLWLTVLFNLAVWSQSLGLGSSLG